MKILITGAGGFLGRVLTQQLITCGHEVNEFSGDIVEEKNVANNFLFNPDYVVHLAGLSNLSECEKDQASCHQINVQGTINLVHAVNSLSRPCGLLFASTAHVYDLSLDRRLILSENSRVSPTSFYGHSKLEAEKFIIQNIKANHRYAVLRFFNHTHKTQSPSFFLPSVYNQILSAAADESGIKTVQVGNVDIDRDIGALKDMVAACSAVIQSRKSYRDIYNVGSGQAKNLKDIIHVLSDKVGAKVKLIVDPARVRANEPLSISADITKFSHYFDWKPSAGVDVESFINSFLSDDYL
ncbi:MAG: NAD(P)-dependent oxidoreductase [Bdellovibrionota bacterium]